MDNGKDTPSSPVVETKTLDSGETQVTVGGVKGIVKESAPSAPSSGPGKVSRRGFIGAMMGLAGAVGIGAWGGHELAKNTSAAPEPTEPPPPSGTNDNAPLENYPVNMLDGVAQNPGSSTPPNPNLESPVPADAVNSGNTYAKEASGKRPDGTYEPLDPDDPEEQPYTPQPVPVDGNKQGPNGEDILPMMPSQAGPLARVETGAGAEHNPLPIKNEGPEPLPMMPKGPDVVAQAQTGAGAERNPPLPPSDDEPDPLPKRGPVADDPVNA